MIEAHAAGKVRTENMTVAELNEYIREEGVACPTCGISDFTDIRKFNLMFKTNQGVIENEENTVYLRPETAQGIFVNFKISSAFLGKLPRRRPDRQKFPERDYPR